MARPKSSNTRFLYFVNVARAINLDNAMRDIIANIIKLDIMSDWLIFYLI